MLQDKVNDNPNSQYDKSFLERNFYALQNNKKEVVTKKYLDIFKIILNK